MNNKQSTLDSILDVVVACCATDIEGSVYVTRERVLSHDRHELIVMTRCILASQIVRAGYSLATVAIYLHRSMQAVRHMLQSDAMFRRSSRAYRIASAEAEMRCKDMEKVSS